MDQHDLEAMRLAIETLRNDPEHRDTIAAMLRTRSEAEVGEFAAGLLQVKNLKLRPWECAPCDTSDGAPADCYGSRPNEIALRQRMKRAGISVYHPDPMAALAAAESKPAA